MNYTTAMVQLPLVKECATTRVRTPDDVSRICDDLRDLAQESIQVLTLNAKNRLINRHLVSLGLVDSSLVHPREVFRAALADSASAITVVHNHPSGDTTPSAEDVRITKQLVEAGKIVGIRVLDHVIVGRSDPDDGNGRKFLSLREEGVVTF